MKFDHAYFVAAGTRLLEYSIRSALRHAIADDIHGVVASEGVGRISRKCLRNNLNSLVLEAMRVHERLGRHDVARRTILTTV